MGGKMQVESLPGVGSSFSFTILFSNASSVTEQLSAPVNDNVMPQTKTAEERLTDEPKRLLIVDDSVENRELMRLLLRTYSLQIDEAGNGQEAVDLSAGICYDLVFMDIQMPVMDGYTATRMIRRIEERSGRNRTKIIALTAHAYESDIQKCLEAGCDGHVAKPFKKKTLLDCLANNL
jgi:CheY-like chemotaxis protein